MQNLGLRILGFGTPGTCRIVTLWTACRDFGPLFDLLLRFRHGLGSSGHFRALSLLYGIPAQPNVELGNLKQPHPTSPYMVVYIGNSTRVALNWESPKP